MKKILFSIVVVAAGLFVASCGNKQEQAPEAAGDEQQTEAQAPEAGETVECDNFTLAVPSGWKYNENGSSSTTITLDAPDYGQFESVTMYVNKEETSAEKLRDQYFGDGAGKEKAADVTIGGKTFREGDKVMRKDLQTALLY